MIEKKKATAIKGLNVEHLTGTKYTASTIGKDGDVIHRECIKSGKLIGLKKVGEKFLAEYLIGNNPIHYTHHSKQDPNKNTELVPGSFFFMKEGGKMIVYFVPNETVLQEFADRGDGRKKGIYF